MGRREPAEGFEEVVHELRRLLAEIQHGSVTVIVQDGRVVQIDATRKLRLANRRSGARPPDPNS